MKLHYATRFLPGLIIAAALPSTASAGCADIGGIGSIQSPFTLAQPGWQERSVAQVQRAAAATRAASNSSSSITDATMVGMWRIQFISQGNTAHNPAIPDGVVIDFGYTQWHKDGMEFLNSGGRSPATQNFCLGVWARAGIFDYELSHFALSYDATSGALNGKVNIRELVTVDPSGNEFTGTFSINVYNPMTGVQVDHVTGILAGKRITVDQTTP